MVLLLGQVVVTETELECYLYQRVFEAVLVKRGGNRNLCAIFQTGECWLLDVVVLCRLLEVCFEFGGDG